MDPDILKLLGSGATVGALLFLIYVVGMRLVAALDRVGLKLDEHTKTDGEAHAETHNAVVRVEAMLTAERRMTPSQGVPIGGYYARPTTNTGGG